MAKEDDVRKRWERERNQYVRNGEADEWVRNVGEVKGCM